MCLRRRMVEKNSGFTGQSSHIECILHQKEYVHVSRLPLSGDKRPEHHELSQLARANRNAIDSFKTLRRRKPLPRSLVEAKKRLPQSATVNSSRKITIFSERWQRSFCRFRHRCHTNSSAALTLAEITEHIYTKFWTDKYHAMVFAQAVVRAVKRLA